ncbi:MAG: hypothetical protein Q4C00_07860, partial [Bacillota bacterium]|nr:hypothetical protein [Bacillota bacterium]
GAGLAAMGLGVLLVLLSLWLTRVFAKGIASFSRFLLEKQRQRREKKSLQVNEETSQNSEVEEVEENRKEEDDE